MIVKRFNSFDRQGRKGDIEDPGRGRAVDSAHQVPLACSLPGKEGNER
jgi:hypothetical protein